MLRTVLLLLFTFGSFVYTLKPASDYFPICHKKDPNIAACIKKSIETLRPSLVKGIPELYLAPLDPMYITKLEMKDGNGNFKFQQTLSNLTIYGLRNFELKNVTVDLDKYYMTIKSFVRHIDFEGDYVMAGKMMVIDIRGSGKAMLNFTDVTTTAYIQGELFKKNGEDYFRVKSLKWKIEPEGGKFYFSNLFNGDKNLGEATNRFLNENWKEAFRVYRSLPEEAFGTLMKDMANRVYSVFPFRELYPE